MKYLKTYVFLIIFTALLIISFLLIKTFIPSLLLGTILAYLFYPLYKFLEKPIKNNSLRAGVVTIILVSISLLIITLIGKIIAAQAVEFFNFARSKDLTETIYSLVQSPLNEQFKQVYDRALITMIRFVSNTLLSLPQRILGIFIAVFSFYYFLKDGPSILKSLKEIIPINPIHQKDTLQKFKNITNALIYGNLIIALIQGFLGGIGFYIFNVTSPILWGLIMIITSFIPVVGTGIIWLPAALWKLLQGDTFNGLGLLIYGSIIISSLDNLLRPKLVSSRANIHPLIILLGVIGGIELFGFIGLIAGPLFLALFLEILKLYKEDLSTTS